MRGRWRLLLALATAAGPLGLEVGQEELQQLVEQQVGAVVLGQLEVAASHSAQAVNAVHLSQVRAPHGRGRHRRPNRERGAGHDVDRQLVG